MDGYFGVLFGLIFNYAAIKPLRSARTKKIFSGVKPGSFWVVTAAICF
jgi:hypothetical protein